MSEDQSQNDAVSSVSQDEVESLLDALEPEAQPSSVNETSERDKGSPVDDGRGVGGAEPESEPLSGAESERGPQSTSEPERESQSKFEPERKLKSTSEPEVQRYDFRHTAFLSSHAFRKLRLRQEEFVNSLASRLSLYLRIEVNLKLKDLRTQTYGTFIDDLSNPTHITLFKIDPMRGIGLLEIHPELGRTIVDRLLGGPANTVESERSLSELEISLLDQIAGLVLDEWCGQWAEGESLKPVVIGHENNGSYLQSATADTMLLVLTLQGKIAETTQSLQIVIPCYSLERLAQELVQEIGHANQAELAGSEAMPEWNSRFDDMRIRISAVLPPVKMTARKLGQLNLGDTIELDVDGANQVLVRFEGKGKYIGRLGRIGNKRVVQLLSSAHD